MGALKTDPHKFEYKTVIVPEDESILVKNSKLHRERAGERIKLYINSAKKNNDVNKRSN